MMPNQNKVHKTAKTVATKQPWEQMKLTYVGHIAEMVKATASKTYIDNNI